MPSVADGRLDCPRQPPNIAEANFSRRYHGLGVVALQEAQGPAPGLQPLLDLVAEDMADVNRIILDKAVSDVELIPKLAHHLIDSGGKRLRPMLTIASAKLCGYQGSGHVRLAAAVEGERHRAGGALVGHERHELVAAPGDGGHGEDAPEGQQDG